MTPGEPSFKIGKGRPVRVTFFSLSTAFIRLYEGLKMGMISAFTRFFRKVPVESLCISEKASYIPASAP